MNVSKVSLKRYRHLTARRKPKEAELKKLLALACFARHGKRCKRCGKSEVVQISHILPQGTYRKLKFELLNVLPLCVGCHIFWWHRNPIEAWEWLRTVMTEEDYSRLMLMRQTIVSGPLDLAATKLYLESVIEKEGGGNYET